MIEVKDLKVHFPIRKGLLRRVVGQVKAVDGINLSIEAGKTYGLVGESGSGKTTTGRAIIGLDHVTSGEILFEGEKIDLRKKASRDIQMIFQNPYSSLNPKKRVLDIVAEPLRNFEKLTEKQELDRIQELLAIVGLSPESVYKYPHEFSGGQRQRIGIARAIALNPKLIIADEPVSALDVSVQAQVLNFMKDIQQELGLTYLFISHDLGIIRHMCDHVGLLYKGRFVEEGTTDDIFENPKHIYTKRLLGAIPSTDPRMRDELIANRRKVNAEFDALTEEYFDESGLAYPLKKISETHSVSMLGEVK